MELELTVQRQIYNENLISEQNFQNAFFTFSGNNLLATGDWIYTGQDSNRAQFLASDIGMPVYSTDLHEDEEEGDFDENGEPICILETHRYKDLDYEKKQIVITWFKMFVAKNVYGLPINFLINFRDYLTQCSYSSVKKLFPFSDAHVEALTLEFAERLEMTMPLLGTEYEGLSLGLHPEPMDKVLDNMRTVVRRINNYMTLKNFFFAKGITDMSGGSMMNDKTPLERFFQFWKLSSLDCMEYTTLRSLYVDVGEWYALPAPYVEYGIDEVVNYFHFTIKDYMDAAYHYFHLLGLMKKYTNCIVLDRLYSSIDVVGDIDMILDLYSMHYNELSPERQESYWYLKTMMAYEKPIKDFYRKVYEVLDQLQISAGDSRIDELETESAQAPLPQVIEYANSYSW